MRVRLAVGVTAALLLLYLAFALGYGVVLIRIGEPVPIGLGIALLVLPLLGVWGLVAEIVFAFRAQKLGERLEVEGGMPADELPLRPSGRFEREAAAAVFPRFQAETEVAPEDWRTWYRLALAYDAAGDRRRARWATRQAIKRAD